MYWYWADDTVSMDVTGGELRITLAANIDGGGYAGMEAQAGTSLVGDAFRVELTEAPDPTSTGNPYIVFQGSDIDRLGIDVWSGEIHFHSRLDDVYDEDVLTFDHTAHRWWQVREDAGRLYFETSPDGVGWTSHRDIASPWYVEGGRVEIGGGSWGFHASPGVIGFDNLSMAGLTDAFCSAASISDDFENSAVRPLWEVEAETDCEIVEELGQVRMTQTVGGGSIQCEMWSRSRYRLDGDGVSVHMPQLPESSSSVFGGIELRQWEVAVGFGFRGGDIYAYLWDNATQRYEDVVYQAREAYEWVRIAHDGADLVFSASPDGTTWSELGRTVAPASADWDVGLSLTDYWTPTSDYAEVLFDEFNLTP
jgi:hypothetical protein